MPVQMATNGTVELGTSKRLRRRVVLPLVCTLSLSGHGNEFFCFELTLDGGRLTRSSTGGSGPPAHRHVHSPRAEKWFPFTPAFIAVRQTDQNPSGRARGKIAAHASCWPQSFLMSETELPFVAGPPTAAFSGSHAVSPLGFLPHGTGIRYRFRCTVVFTYANTEGSGPGAM